MITKRGRASGERSQSETGNEKTSKIEISLVPRLCLGMPSRGSASPDDLEAEPPESIPSQRLGTSKRVITLFPSKINQLNLQ